MRRPLFMVCLCFVIIMGLSARRGDRPELDGTNCIVTGRVYQKDTEYFYLDSIDSFSSDYNAAGQQQEISFTDNLICEKYEGAEVMLGSRVCVLGTFDAFSVATNPGEFDRKEYYQSLGIGGKLKDTVILEQSEEHSLVRELLYQIRVYYKERLYCVFPKKEASVMCAMLLGDKTELDADIKRLYQENGIMHILSISGLHITIIGVSIYGMLRKGGFPVWMAALCGGCILVLYGVMTGMSVSALRAIGMYLLRLLSEVMGRTYDMLTALGVMAFVAVWINPGYLHNAGFLLSFGAVLGIGVLYPTLLWEEQKNIPIMYEGRRWKRITEKAIKKIGNGLKQSILAGLSVTLMTLPVQLWFYYEIATYSVLINLFIIPLMSMLMICGLLSMLVPGFGILGTVDCMILNWYEILCEGFGNLPFHQWNPGKPEWWQLVVYYVLLTFALVVNGVRKNRRNSRMTLLLILTMAVIAIFLPTTKKTVVTFLDVGQGDGICIRLESGEVYLFDCGSSNRNQVGEYVLKPFLKYYGIREIDAVFVSHPDEDHCNGILELLQNQEEWGIAVKELVLPDLAGVRVHEEFEELTNAVNQSGSVPKVTFLNAGDSWTVDGNQFVCLHPPESCTLQESNTYSQCFYIKLSNGVSLLLTGDVEAEGEELLLAELKKRNIREVTVLKVAHHGSKYSTGSTFLTQIQPQVAVISCGAGNFYGHPHRDTLERLETVGCTILTTPEYGAVGMKCGETVEIYYLK